MIFNKLTLENFGIFRGRHEMDLSPDTRKPIILFGALNGSGKTTLLDAFQLALYGKAANCSGRGSLSYSAFLSRSINREAAPQTGAVIDLELTHHLDGRDESISVRRSWNIPESNVIEKLEVFRDGIFDNVLTEHWDQYVEEIIPSKISELFFFDGEKIESLADLKRASEILRTGVNALLGLEKIDQLHRNVALVKRRRINLLKEAKSREKLEQLEREFDQASKERTEIAEKLASLQNEIDQIEKQRISLDDQFRQAGGDLYLHRDALKEAHKEKDKQLRLQEEHLREMAGEDLPLLLVGDLIDAAISQAEKEDAASRSAVILDEVVQRDVQVISLLRTHNVPMAAVKAVSAELDKDRGERAKAIDVDRYLGISPVALMTMGSAQRQARQTSIRKELKRTENLQQDVEEAMQKLLSVPEEGQVADLLTHLRDAEKQLLQKKARYDLLHEELERMARVTDDLKRSLVNEEKLNADQLFKDETSQRVIQHAEKVEKTLLQFKQEILSRSVADISGFILKSFKDISRKTGLIQNIQIDPESFKLNLTGKKGEELTTDRLSAGERQMLALAILWGLARASGRPLPTIIDTPLGRLDSKHRLKLVDHYFPKASHQTVILSTDEEIDSDLFIKLEPAVARSYIISYNEELNGSEIHNGYFQ